MKKIVTKNWDELENRSPEHGLVAGVDLVIVRNGDDVTVLYGRCAHRGALMSDGQRSTSCLSSCASNVEHGVRLTVQGTLGYFLRSLDPQT